MKQHKLSERLYAVGNFTVRRDGENQKRIDGNYLLLKRTTSGGWAVHVPIADIPRPARVPGMQPRPVFETRAAAVRYAEEQVELMVLGEEARS